MAQETTTVSVDGHRLRLTHLDKVMYPETGTTKGDVLGYYAAVADRLIAHARDRAVTRKRWVDGVEGPVFFQKNLEAGAPSWIRRHRIEHSDHDNVYPMVDDLATLTWLAQMGALELHVPQWRFGPRGAERHPDRLVLDLDPGEGAGLPECVEVARLARRLLQDVGLEPVPVTSGSKGIHLYVGLDGSRTSGEIAGFAHELARALEADHPDLVVSDQKKTLRQGRVLVDWSQNNGKKTTIAPYSLRGRERPTVAAPRTWRELAAKGLRQLEYPEVLDALRRRGDPLDGLGEGHPDAALGDYRAKRDPERTPEPFGDHRHRERITAASGSDEGDRPVFVIQEHHARRLHWDFRLEHDGVLVSWALPKGVPTEPGRNHLAVQTEDHPMDYAGFEGDIPGGEYGAGHVDIWDEGWFALEKWRPGREVIATLHGRRGAQRYALIHTDADQWLIHLMKEQRTDAAEVPTATSRSKRSSKRTHATTAAAAPAATAPIPEFSPMLATLARTGGIPTDQRERWAYEMKWDGVRAMVTVRDGAVDLRSRNGLDLTPTFPELSAITEAVAAAVQSTAVLDGEVVALDARGRPDFGRLQQRLGLTAPADVERARSRVGVAILLFDLLWRDGVDLTGLPYTERRALLLDTVTGSALAQVPPDAGDDLDDALETSRELGLEGVMAKRRDSRYAVGRRSEDWLKFKHRATQEVVVVGWTDGTGHRAGSLGALLLGVPDAEGLRYVGKVGTGFRDRDLAEMRERFERMPLDAAPARGVPSAIARAAHWVRPEFVGEVEFAERTRDGLLRQPAWRGWRPDKSPGDVVDEVPPG